MRWYRFDSLTWYSGRIGDPNCRFIHRTEFGFLVDKPRVFMPTLEEAKLYHEEKYGVDARQ